MTDTASTEKSTTCPACHQPIILNDEGVVGFHEARPKWHRPGEPIRVRTAGDLERCGTSGKRFADQAHYGANNETKPL